jgi:hypothetical protein
MTIATQSLFLYHSVSPVARQDGQASMAAISKRACFQLVKQRLLDVLVSPLQQSDPELDHFCKFRNIKRMSHPYFGANCRTEFEMGLLVMTPIFTEASSFTKRKAIALSNFPPAHDYPMPTNYSGPTTVLYICLCLWYCMGLSFTIAHNCPGNYR